MRVNRCALSHLDRHLDATGDCRGMSQGFMNSIEYRACFDREADCRLLMTIHSQVGK